MSFGLGGSQTSGIPESGPGGFLDSLLGSLHKVNEMRDESQIRKIEIGSAQRAAAKQQLDQLIPILKANPNMTTDPKMLAKAKQLAQVAGLPDPTTTQPGGVTPPAGGVQTPQDGAGSKVDASSGTPQVGGQFKATDFGTPTLPKESINMNIVAPPTSWDQLDQKTRDDILQAPPGPSRDAKLDGIGAVPDYVRTAPSLLTSSNKNAIIKSVEQTMHDFNTGVSSGPAAAAQIQAMVTDAASAGINTQSLIDMVHHEAALGPETSMKLAQYQSIISKNMSAKDASEAMARYHDMLTVEMPNKIEAMIRQGDTRLQQGQERVNIQEQNAQTNAQRAAVQGEAAMLNARAHMQIADAAGSRAQTAKQTLDFNAAKASVTQLNVVASQLNKDYDSIQKSINQMVQNGGDPGAKDTAHPNPDGTPGPSLFDQLAEVSTKRDVTIQQQMDTTQFVQSQGTNAYRAASGFQSGQITRQNDTQPTDPTGRFQIIYQNEQPAGTFDTQTNKYQPFGGATQPTGGIPGGQPRAQGINAGPKLPPKNPANNSVGQPPKDMKPGTVEFFKTLTPQQQVQYMKSPKVPVEVKQYLRSIAPKTNDDQARQHAQGHTMGGAGGGRAMDENTNHIISNTARSNSDPWASVSQIQQSYEPAYRMGAGAQTLQDMSKAGANATQTNPLSGSQEPNVFQQIGQGVGAAGKAIGGAVQGIENFGKTINSGSRAQGAPAGKPIETQDAQAKLAQAALPVVKQELDSGKPVTQILMEMSQHGITHDTAMRILQQLHAAGYQPPQMWGGSEGLVGQ